MECYKPLDPVPPYKIPDRLPPQDIASTIAVRLTGAPADGNMQAAASAPGAPKRVVWVDHGDEVLVHLDSLRTQIVGRTLLVSVDLETDQTGRASLIVPLVLGGADDPAGLVAVTEDLPRGNGLLASRWGPILQDALWASLTNLAADHASERLLAPRGIALTPDGLQLHAAAPVSASLTGGNTTGR